METSDDSEIAVKQHPGADDPILFGSQTGLGGDKHSGAGVRMLNFLPHRHAGATAAVSLRVLIPVALAVEMAKAGLVNDQTRDAAVELQNLATRLLRSARAAHAKQGLSSAQYSALAVLYDRGATSLVELARAERVAHPTMSRIVSGLSKRGAVERVTDPADGRLRLVEITTEGRSLYEEVSARRIAIAEAILRSLKPDTVGELVDVVRRVAAKLDE